MKSFRECTAQTMTFSIKDFFSKCDQILNGKVHFLCSDNNPSDIWSFIHRIITLPKTKTTF